jgi:DNA repair ATPase RecN
MSKITTWLIAHWKTIAIIIAVILAVGYMQYSRTSLIKLLSDTQQSHKKELDDISKQHLDTIKQRDEAIKQYEEKLQSIQQEYDAAKKALEAKKSGDAKKIIDETKGDPQELAKKLAQSTGFVIVLP